MRRPLIALPGHRFPPGHTYKIEPAFAVISDYLDAIWRAGGLPVPVFPDGKAREVASTVLEEVDGVVAIGGFDVDPRRYDQVAHETVMPAPPDQEEFEVALIEGALQRRLPLLAICRGAQLLNVMLGGTLHQHITEVDGFDSHGVPNGGGGTTNTYRFDSGSLIAEVIGSSTATGRCHHHQAVDRVAPGLIVTGRTADGTVEVLEFERPESWMLAVQWHPEETAATDTSNQRLFDQLVKRSAPAAPER